MQQLKTIVPAVPENIYFVGRNYVGHISELKNQRPKRPLIFSKPRSCVRSDGAISYPKHTKELHFEGEMVFLFGVGNSFFDGEFVLVGCGIDFTARDVQSELKNKGWPWFEAKCFEGSAAMSKEFTILPEALLPDLTIETYVNGFKRQSGRYDETIFHLEVLENYLRGLVSLKKGDALYTGTPAGVAPLQKGDRVEVRLTLDGSHLLSKLSCEVS